MKSMNPNGNHCFERWLRLVCRWLALLSAQIVFLFAASLSGLAHAASPSFAFYYADDIPYESLGAFDYAVLEPDHVDLAQAKDRLDPHTRIVAYLSVGEVHPSRPYFKQMNSAWKLGENAAWQSVVVNLADVSWRKFFIEQAVAPLWNRGFRAFFLDTMDSFYLVAKTPPQQQAQIDGLALLIEEMRAQYPQMQLVLNRGFEVLPRVHSHVMAVAAESLFQGHDAGRQQYVQVSEKDREWLWGQLRKARDEFKLQVIAIDYVPPEQRELARQTAERIKALGATPWVATPGLDSLGVGQVEVMPRQVLVLHDEPGHWRLVSLHEAHRVGAMPLNYLGLEPEYVPVSASRLKTLADRPLAGRYAGVVAWFHPDVFPTQPALPKLLRQARAQGVPQVWMGALGPDALLSEMGLDKKPMATLAIARALEKKTGRVDFEVNARLPQTLERDLRVPTSEGSEVWLSVLGEGGAREDVIAITPWGGYASSRHWKLELIQNEGLRWVIDPVEFLRKALKRDGTVPVPDVSTENGRRLLITHIDGDGFASASDMPGSPLASRVMLDDFLRRYPIPTTVSVIEAEISQQGIYAGQSARTIDIARQVFRLPHVEVASHTYSHPFYWADLELGIKSPDKELMLDIKGYKYDPVRETAGSANYINRQLAPEGKRTRMLLWSGDTQPLLPALKAAHDAGLLNMNGGMTTITRAEPSLSLIAPLGMMKEGYYQVYAPNQNENVYTNLWTGPFYGYERAIETFELTDKPRRFKPVNIYYHTYIASKKASIASLHKVYQWAMAKPLFATYASEYAQRVIDWRRATVARDGTSWRLRSGGEMLRQWRLDDVQSLSAWSGAAGVVGHVQHQRVVYLHAGGDLIDQTARAQDLPVQIIDVNARLRQWTQASQGREWRMEFEAHMPLRVRLHAPQCHAQLSGGGALRVTRQGKELHLEGAEGGRQTVVLRCAG
jgi:polysaccharide biosynthesis protein PelA